MPQSQPPAKRADSPGNITIHPETPTDESFLFSLYASTRENELAATGWNETARAQFLQLQFRAMRQSYRSMFPNGEFSILQLDGQAIGRLVVNRTSEEIRVVDIALLPDYRNRGLGGSLLRSILAEAKDSGRSVRLHVLKGAAAEHLYIRLGFRAMNGGELHHQMEWNPNTAA